MPLHSDGATIVVVGPLDSRTLAGARDEVYRHVPDHDVVVDLSQCEWLDGAALRMLVAATVLAQRGGHRVVLRGCVPRVRRLLHRTGAYPRLEIESQSA